MMGIAAAVVRKPVAGLRLMAIGLGGNGPHPRNRSSASDAETLELRTNRDTLSIDGMEAQRAPDPDGPANGFGIRKRWKLRPIKVLLLCAVAVSLLTIASVYRQRSNGSDAPSATINPPVGDLPDASGGSSVSGGGASASAAGDPSRPFSVSPLPRLDPGTVVGDAPPTGWSHLIFKSRSRLASGAIDSLPAFARELAEFIFYAMTARVVRDSDGVWGFDQVAIGLGTRIGAHDVIISSAAHKKLGADLGPIKSIVLSYAEQRLDKMVVAFRSRSMAIVDTPTLLHIDGKNRETLFRYLFLVEPRTGGLATIVWRIDLGSGGEYLRLGSEPTLIQPNLVSVTALHVDGSKITAGIPSSQAFAGKELPTGVTLRFLPEAAQPALAKPLSVAAADKLEAAFRNVLSEMQGSR